MTYTQVEPGVLRRLSVDVEDRSARLLFIELLDYGNATGSDGAIPLRALRFVTDAEDPRADVEALVEAGFVEETATGWQVVEWTKRAHQERADRVIARQEASRESTDRNRRHQRGDHSKCNPERCKAARDASRDASQN